ncbi:hypothetical protein FTUN_4798 [Frigoriglobus tundricola]|uniref:Uncharacterized protein n=1 Tax=Frigoriglobus tundricola TaxID=2774151 RepID=A0A6M5YTN7_9BACT|nr:hypothetical protein FTUN_4798 [Frigoriglobus tundricola]
MGPGASGRTPPGPSMRGNMVGSHTNAADCGWAPRHPKVGYVVRCGGAGHPPPDSASTSLVRGEFELTSALDRATVESDSGLGPRGPRQ